MDRKELARSVIVLALILSVLIGFSYFMLSQWENQLPIIRPTLIIVTALVDSPLAIAFYLRATDFKDKWDRDKLKTNKK
jgi:hypothetical protein